MSIVRDVQGREGIAEGLGVLEDPSEMTFALRPEEQGFMVGVGSWRSVPGTFEVEWNGTQ